MKEFKINGRKPTIEDLERILNHDADIPFEILPNGQIVEVEGRSVEAKPLTFRENLGGEYA